MRFQRGLGRVREDQGSWPSEVGFAILTSVDSFPLTWPARSIGVSNFNMEQLQAIAKDATVKPAVNQVGIVLITRSNMVEMTMSDPPPPLQLCGK